MSDKPAKKGMDDETKRKFREALEKKKGHGGTDVSDHGGGSRVGQGHTGPSSEKHFRRKAGG